MVTRLQSNDQVIVTLTEYGREEVSKAMGVEYKPVYQCALWVVMKQLGPLAIAGGPAVFESIEKLGD